MKSKIQLQPHVVVLTNDITEIDSCAAYAVVSSKVFYAASLLLEAVDVCMKATFVFGLQFPITSNSSWVFLQRGIYNLNSRFDFVPSKVNELISDVKRK